MWDGWLCLGGNEVGNTARTLGYAATADCGVGWLINRDCGGLEDALADQPYDHAFIQDAPWYDPGVEATSRFYGLYMLGNSGLSDSTRVGSFTEGIADGGVPGDVRYTGKSIRYRAWMTARGEDALEAGMSWLNAALAPSECGMHGGSCGATDLSFFVSCPPPRGEVADFTPWVERRRNHVTNPSVETVAGTIVARENLQKYPADAPTGTTGWTTYRTNLSNPGGYIRGVVNEAAGAGASGITTQVSTAAMAAVTPGQIVKLSGELRAQGSNAIVGMALQFYDASLTYISGSQVTGPSGVAAPGRWRTFSVPAQTAPANAAYVRILGLRLGSSIVGDIIDMRRVTLELSSATPGAPFTGRAAPALRTNYNVNPRMMGSTAGWSPNGPGVTLTAAPDGVQIDMAEGRGASGLLMFQTGSPDAVEGEQWSGSVDLTVPVGYPALTLTWSTRGYTGGSSHSIGATTVTIQPGQTVRVSATSLVFPAGTTAVRNWLTASTAAPVGARVIASRAILEAVPTPGSYFDPTEVPQGRTATWEGAVGNSYSSLYDSDLTAAWTGTADASSSTLRANRPAGVSTSVSAAAVYQSGWWASTGSKSVKVQPTGESSSSYGSVQVSGLEAGQTYTAIAKLRLPEAQSGSLNGTWLRQLMAQSAGMPVNNVLSNRAPNEAGVHELRVTFTLGASTSMTLFLMNGSSVTPAYFDDFAVVPGIYDGPYFDGSTADSELVRYNWEGAADASTSTMDVRELTSRPQTDEEYDEIISPLIRHLHNVICISGPLEVETRISSDKQHWGRLVEFTLYAGMPWTFSQTKELELSPTAATVVQDSPFNLVTVPSAELAGAAVVAATNYSTNPSVETNDTGWSSAPTTVSGSAPTPFITAGRVTNELQAVGTSSYRIRLLGNGTAASGRAALQALQSVDLAARPAGSRVSVSIWGALLALGGAGVTTLVQLDGRVDWYTSGNVFISSTFLKTLTDPAQFGGSVFAQRSMTPPATATKATIVLRGTFDWASGATNSDVRLYADALAVTVP